ncbi:MAG: GNAT family N-acetyltransferase [Bacteroidales bacterium]|nr:GNAT family N-acetyltransferase [Bacteroidales bacterium]
MSGKVFRSGKKDFIIRDYKQDDFREVARLWESTGMGRPERSDSNEVILRTLKTGGALLVMVEKDSGTICGTSWITSDGRRTYLHHFGILPSFQGRGLANLLMEATLEKVRDAGLQAKLEVHRSNHRAVSLYKKFGFGYLGDYDVYIKRDI